MIEFLGVGVRDGGGTWLLHRVCAQFERGELTAVVTARHAEGRAFLDALTGRRIPAEGRVWVERLPLMRETASRVRGLVTEAGPEVPFTDYRSVLWNTLVTPSAALRSISWTSCAPHRRSSAPAGSIVPVVNTRAPPIRASASAMRRRPLSEVR